MFKKKKDELAMKLIRNQHVLLSLFCEIKDNNESINRYSIVDNNTYTLSMLTSRIETYKNKWTLNHQN